MVVTRERPWIVDKLARPAAPSRHRMVSEARFPPGKKQEEEPAYEYDDRGALPIRKLLYHSLCQGGGYAEDPEAGDRYLQRAL